MPCGNLCPPPCPPDVPYHLCPAFFAKNATNATHNCEDFVLQGLQRMVAEVPMEGCTGPCRVIDAAGASSWVTPADGKPGCCTQPTSPHVDFKATVADGAPTIWQRFTIPGIQQASEDNDPAATPLAMYQDYVNFIANCAMTTCACPTSRSTASSPSPSFACSGHGACLVEGTQSNGAPSFACVCSAGYSGPACDIQADSGMCPMAWDPTTKKIAPCTNAAQGTCKTQQVDGSTVYKCECKSGWTGAACDVRMCPSVDGVLCAGNGSCVDATGLCVCEKGFAGSACNCTVDSSTGKKVCQSTDPPPSAAASTSTASTSAGGSTNTSHKASLTRDIIICAGAAFVLLLIVVGIVLFVKAKHGGRSKAGPSTASAKVLSSALQLMKAKSAK